MTLYLLTFMENPKMLLHFAYSTLYNFVFVDE